MTTTNQGAGLAGQDNDNFQAEGKQRPEHHPRPGGGVHTPPTCGHLIRALKEDAIPQAIQGIGPQDGFEGSSSPQDNFNKNSIKNSIYKEGGISPPVSPPANQSGPPKSSENSMAANIRGIVLATNQQFTAGEIFDELVKTPSISPPTIKEEKQHLKKIISNELRDLHGRGLLVKIKRGVYGRPDNTETNQVEVDENDSTPELQFIATESLTTSYLDIREACRTDFSETSSKPLPLRLPLNLEDDFHAFPGTETVICGAKNAGKTLMAIDTMRLNMDIIPCTYINSEMQGGELKNRLTALGQAYDITFEEFEAKVEFFDCRCNALNKGDMDKLAALLNPNGCNIIDYIKVTDDFYKVGECLERIHTRLKKGIAIIFFQKKPGFDQPLGGHYATHLPRTVILLDYDKKTQVRRLTFEKVKFPARENSNPESMTIYYDILDNVRMIREGTAVTDEKEDAVKA